MKRKLVQQGESTLMISLPRDWILKNSLVKGDELSIDLQNNVLVLSSGVTQRIVQKERIELSDESETNIRTLVTTLYRKGTDEITIQYKSQKQFKIIQTVVSEKLLGYEVTKKSDDEILIDSIAEPAYDKFDDIFQKIFYSANELFDKVISEYQEQKTSQDVSQIMSRIQRYDNFCRRAIAKNVLADKKTDFLWSFLAIYIHALRELHFLHELPVNKRNIKTIHLILSAKEMSKLLQEAVFKKDISRLDKIHELEKKVIYEDAYAIFESDKQTVSIYHATSLVRQLYLCCSNLLGFIL